MERAADHDRGVMDMRLKWTLAAGLVATALVAPATAAAAPAVPDVRDRLEAARTALSYSAWAAEMGSAAHVSSAFDRFETITARAERMARRVDGRRARARAITAVGRTVDLGLDRFAEILDEVPPQAQAAVADAIGHSVEARNRMVSILTRLAERLPEPARRAVVRAITAFQADGDVESLIAALTSDDVLNAIKVIVTGHLESVAAHIDEALDRLGDLATGLPPRAQAAVDAAVATIREQLDGASELIAGILESLPGGALPDGVTDGLCDVLDRMPVPVPCR